MQAHRFLEAIKETLTVQAMREKLRSTGAIAVWPAPAPLPTFPTPRRTPREHIKATQIILFTFYLHLN
jgi:hypothetical protein